MRKKKPTSRKPVPKRPVKSSARSDHAYQRFKSQQAEISRERSAEGRDIAEGYPEIANIARRERCRDSLKLFCDTYNPDAFYLGWSADGLESVKRIEEAARQGALFTFAEARGSGKTTRVRMAALWVASYAHARYPFVIGATDGKATDTLNAIKVWMRFLPIYAEDFPEISYPIQRLEGIAHRAPGQLMNGKPTMIEWTSDHIVLPTMPPPANWPKRWKLRSDKMVPTSGVVFSTSGLTGEGIRGSLKTLTTGEQVRPDFVLLDDPQTAESASSPSQNSKREQLISADVLGMAGPGAKIGCVMPCTIIRPGDAMDHMTDRSKHPLWRGSRSGILRSMPKNMEAWDWYFEVYRQCAQKEPPDFTEANDYYTENQDTLDAGAVASWEERRLPGEVSAIQHAMNLYCRDRRAFMSEYMNQPDPVDLGQTDELDADDITNKLNGIPRGTIPPGCSRLTAFIDVGKYIHFWCVVAWGEQFNGHVVDYGTYPKQSGQSFRSEDPRPSLEDKFPNHNEEARVRAGLKETAAMVLGRHYPQHAGGTMQVEKCLIDSAKWTKTVTEFCREPPFSPIITPSRGYGIGAGAAPMSSWAKKDGERRDPNGGFWVIRPNTEGGYGRVVLSDTNHWKSVAARAILTPPSGSGCLMLFGDKPNEHRLFSEHLTAEYRVATQGRGRKLEEWKIRPERMNNHWWDCLVGNFVAASLIGVSYSAVLATGDTAYVKEPRKKVKLSDLYFKKHGERAKA